MPESRIAVVIGGINGRMGRASAQAIAAVPGFKLVGAYGKPNSAYIGQSVDALVGIPENHKTDILINKGLSDCLNGTTADILLDFTEANNSCSAAIEALKKKVRPIIGTSGLTQEHFKQLEETCLSQNLGALVVPNFSIGAILMMHFAQQASKLFENIEITEMHHLGKLDAPSGTAMHTARKIAETKRTFNKSAVTEKELVAGARGGKWGNGVRLHSLRLPGILSRQEVLFGAEGELFTIRHESFNTKCFVQGILLSLKEVMSLKSLVIGLDNFVVSQLSN